MPISAPPPSWASIKNKPTTMVEFGITDGVRSLNGQTGNITDTSDGAIGSYVVAAPIASGTTVYAANATVAGSSLQKYSGTHGPGFQYGASSNFANAGLSGTWRQAGGRVASGNEIWGNSDYRLVSLWVRIA